MGCEFTYQAAADPVLGALTRRMLERETSTTLPKLAGMDALTHPRSVDRAYPQQSHPSSMPSDRHGWIAEDRPASRRSFARASRSRPARGLAHPRGRQLDRLWFERGASLRRALDAVRSLRGSAHRDRRKEFRLVRAQPVCSRRRPHLRDGYDTRRAHQSVRPGHLRGLLGGDPYGYLKERLGDEQP